MLYLVTKEHAVSERVYFMTLTTDFEEAKKLIANGPGAGKQPLEWNNTDRIDLLGKAVHTVIGSWTYIIYFLYLG